MVENNTSKFGTGLKEFFAAHPRMMGCAWMIMFVLSSQSATITGSPAVTGP